MAPLTPTRRVRWRHVGGLWLELRVVPVMLWSVSAICLGSAVGWAREPGWFAVTLAIGVLIQGVVAHAVNEITDWRSGTDRHDAPRVLSGGSKVIQAGLLTPGALVLIGCVGAAAATGLGVWVASQRGWWLLALGAGGLVGAVLYTLPPAAAAYSPFTGEAVAFTCVVACAIGGFGVQAGEVAGHVVLIGSAHASFCVAMLMLHHYLDMVPDLAARPPKRTTVAVLGSAAQRYCVAWATAAAVLWAVSVVTVDHRLTPGLVAAATAVAVHVRARPADPESVTRAELTVIALGISGSLISTVWIAPDLVWVLALPLVALPLERAVARRLLSPEGLSGSER